MRIPVCGVPGEKTDPSIVPTGGVEDPDVIDDARGKEDVEEKRFERET